MPIRPDNRLADAPMVAVRCRRCAATVLARKSSWHQTSVQWDAAAVARCEERHDAQKLASHGQRIFLACSTLSDSIADAVVRGELTTLD
ncbi:ferredoxin [Mycolicibacterium flavescens]|uniref:Ferredoxin n=1 Tax=Mycolicibacterium flavescens TaxID=1776 RepID=A0A1E3RLX0_MYCFV|nr:ferredoxin [Mycolicibacterium flavescens]MCV7281105.1 ferredoxin [Mycolicibacterium flavescens]ODQ90397.1 ferredoxin [Mycolicibacterium flavescens]